METESQVDELVDRWKMMRDQGTPPTIEELCTGHPELAAEVRRRIEALQAMDSALVTLSGEPWSTGEGSEDRGPPLDRELPEVLHATAVYRVQGHHDHGGLGIVFTARHEELDRTVALKRIRPDRLYDAARRRFLREAALTAGLQHPGIVPIYGLGQDEDGPFYTMPFIEGQTLQAAINAFHGEQSLRRDPGRRSLELRRLLQHVIAACNTVAYAHDRGVVHRDLKPSNIMLGPYGETLVMDWGLAKRFGADDATGEGDGDLPSPSPSPEDITATGEVMDTPRYMSPEQARGEPAGPASDIFSLGLVLYAILTGKSAFDESRLRGPDRLQAVRDAAIVPPRRRDPALPRALEAICLKALSGRPEDRYATGRALADDVMKWLADEPVTAWREPVSIRARRWMRRHRTLVISTAAVLISSLVGLAGFTTVLAGKNAELAEQSRALDVKNAQLLSKNQELEKQQQRTEERETLAIDAVKKFRDAVTANLDLKDRPELGGLRKALLSEPLEFYRALRDRLQSDRDTRPEALAKLVLANLDLADTTRQIGSIPDAIRSYTESIAILEGLARDHPTCAECRRDLAISQNNLGLLLHATGHPTEALESYRQALAIWELLVRDQPSVTDYQSELAACHSNLGGLLNETGHAAEALEAHRKGLAIRERLAAEHPALDGYQHALAESDNNMGLLPQSPTDALERLRKALAIRERLVRDHPAVSEYQSVLATSYINIGGALRTDQPADALEAFRQAVAIGEQLDRDHPTVTKYQADLALSYNNLGLRALWNDSSTDPLLQVGLLWCQPSSAGVESSGSRRDRFPGIVPPGKIGLWDDLGFLQQP
jgi:serine/threonine protein kinase